MATELEDLPWPLAARQRGGRRPRHYLPHALVEPSEGAEPLRRSERGVEGILRLARLDHFRRPAGPPPCSSFVRGGHSPSLPAYEGIGQAEALGRGLSRASQAGACTVARARAIVTSSGDVLELKAHEAPDVVGVAVTSIWPPTPGRKGWPSPRWRLSTRRVASGSKSHESSSSADSTSRAASVRPSPPPPTQPSTVRQGS